MIKALIVLVFVIGLLRVLANQEDSPAAAPPPDPHAGMRAACKQFIERRQLETANASWGEWTEWTLVDNGDNTVSVGARYSVGSRTRYTNCILTRDGDEIRLIKLTRLQ